MNKTVKPEVELADTIVQYLKNTPHALALVFFAFLEGHLWVFMITTYVKKDTKGNTQLKSALSRTAVGLIWMGLNLTIMHMFQFKSWPSQYENIIQSIIPTIILSLVLQLFAFCAFVIIGARK